MQAEVTIPGHPVSTRSESVRGMLKAVDFLVAVEGTPYIRPKRSQYKIWRSRSDKKHKRGK